MFSGFLAFQELPPFIVSSLAAVLCGIIIGLERESKGKPAGLRTLVLISLGSCIYVETSILLAGARGDPARIAAQIVTGIGFLGAGAILQKSEQGYIAGLTTAASIWVTAAVGMLVGTGHYIIALAGVIIVVLALRLLGMVEGALFYEKSIEYKKVYFEANYGKTRWALMGVFEENMIRPDEYVFHEDARGRPCIEFKYVHKNRNHRTVLAQIAALPQVLEIL